MKFGKIGMTALAVLFALPVYAQSTSTTSGASTHSKTPTVSQSGKTGPSTQPSLNGSTNQANSGAKTTASSKPIDINSASEKELDSLPGVGKSRADAIIRNRPYHSKNDLVTRHIVPESVYNGIKERIIAHQG
jgi:DNA uptake protein ComE-like DNA-binding protein